MTTQNVGGSTTARRPAPLVLLALCATLPFACRPSQPDPGARPAQSALSAPSLGVAASFRVLGASMVTNTGATTIEGNLGVSPGLAITGFPPGLVIGGAVHAGDATALQAQSDVTAAYLVLAGETCTSNLTGQDLGGLTLTQGVYCFSSEAQLTGTLTLNAQGDPSAVFVFQVGSTLTTASNASVVFTNGGQDCGAFWQIGSSATLGSHTAFAGSILALTSIALETGASVSGRALARNGAVTMDANHLFAGPCVKGSDAGVDAGAADAGASDAGVDAGAGGGGGTDAGVDAGAADAGAVDAGEVDSGAADAGVDGGTDAGILCCGDLCGATCTNLQADIANCGACGNVCGSGEFCAAGSCVACSPVCGGACVDLAGDRANCGSCGHVCLGTELCSSGSCVACGQVCGAACVDLGSDQGNCGSCGKACLASEVCTSGSCVACPMTCGGACVDLNTNTLNCGSCGNSCAPGESCSGGSCVCQ